MAWQLLFVDDDPLIRGLYSSLSARLGTGHDIHTAANGLEALELVHQRHFDVVISDLAMPEMEGTEFLGELVSSFPGSARIIISAFPNQMRVAESLNSAHRYIEKPVNLNDLAGLLKRICRYSHLLPNERIRRLVLQKGALPVPPETCLKLNEMLDSPYAELGDIAPLIEQDPALTIRLLQLVNSAQFGASREIVTAGEAVQILGLEVLRALMLGIQIFSFYEASSLANSVYKDLWRHSMTTAAGARTIARLERQPTEICNEAFLAGLLHDIGKIILASNAEREYRLVLELCRKTGVPVDQAEMGIFACTHAQIGGFLLALWGVPDPVVRAVELHHSAEDYPLRFSPVLALHAAQYLDPSAPRMERLNTSLLKRIGLEDRIPVWQQGLKEAAS